ncbi:UAA transporter family protein [Candida parapsilosis]|uniref:EamA domain-containing protein n=2 Tax=Candida parapsilosis TaxID=5480 RepID=G8BJ44_CANPC|nr:uncharacterized protein CPAR2_404630 [Candida parapsilosis]KAF6045972.1 UAA transporter family protein [Candida parapsilosis]KAF6046477.1 UAA transporter family protein [Candida parapsilosis]KAF6051082.1 UAA transporter family protein [Candida parapsilosis]KAF6062195.1 UAA transporter family protein [Candida parapsilosis]KAI5903719.1 putative vacuolar membrane protein [Candida parapsilosis]
MSAITNTRISVLRYITAFFVPDASLHSRQKWILGLINLSAVVILWVSSSFLVNAIVEDDSYRKPFFITWINTSCFSFYIIPYLKFKKMTLRQFINKFTNEYKYHQIPSKDGDGLIRSYGSDEDLNTVVATQVEPEPGRSGSLTCVESIGDEVVDNSLDINIYDTFKLAIQFIILWYSANLVTNASLSYTSVASQTILSSTSSFFTLIIGYLVSVESINQNKIMGILLSFSGVLIVTKADTSENNPNKDLHPGPSSAMWILWGNLLALSGALIYGIYTILLKFKTSIPNSHKERNLNTHLFFGFVGLICFLGLWPILIILHFTKVETWSLPSSREVWTCLVLNAVITFISDFCWCNAVLLTSPLTVTVGLSMAIPLAMVGDWILKEFQLNLLYVFGAAIVTTGFLIINKDEEEEFVVDE